MPTENINPIYFLSPLIPVIIGFALIFYWRARRSFRWIVLVYGLVAYASAILIKFIFQAFTAANVVNHFGAVSVETGLYYGLQTSFLEVGIAYVVVMYAIRKKAMSESDAEAYGLSLSFWENVGLLGILSLVNLLATYLTIGYGPQGIASTVRNALLSTSPALFGSTWSALPSIGLSIMERTSSLFAHFAWGFLVVAAASRRKIVYFLVALPMGLIDALVPYASSIGILEFELLLFGITVVFVLIAVYVMKREGISPFRQKVAVES